MKDSRVKITVTGKVAHIELCRADKMNALDADMLSALLDVPQKINADKSIRAVVLSGQGENFCSGLDKTSFMSIVQGQGLQIGEAIIDDLAQRSHGIANALQAVAWQWHELAVPVIAAIEGVAFGGGLQIALGADMRYASKSSQFSIMEIKWGLIPDMAGSQLMRHLVRADVIKELTYTGRVFGAAQAQQYGFVTALEDSPLDAAFAVADQIQAHNPQAIRACKSLLNKAPYLDAEQGLLLESQLQKQIIASPNQIEAVQAKMQKRAPDFNDDD